MFQEADISVTTSPAVATFSTPAATLSSATVATSAAAANATSAAAATSATTASAVTAAPIKIINDEVIRPACVPNGSILRGLLTKDATSAGEEKVNLLEGLGDDFLINEPIDEQTIALIIEEITPAENATMYNELVEQNPSTTELHKEEEITTNLSQALPSSISSPGTLPTSETEDEDDDDIMLGPASGGKRKHIRGCGGKGAKIFKPLIEEKSTASSKLFSQPEHKVLMRDYQNLIAQVEEQKRQCEERKRESQRMLTSLSSRREEVEVQQKVNKLHLRRLLEKLKKIQDMIQEQKKKCREDEDMIMSLLRDEIRLTAEQDGYHEKLHWFDRRLLALRVAAEDH